MQKKPRVLTWHIHGNYLYYLTHVPFEFYLPKGEGEGYGGRMPGFDWGDNVHDVPVDQVKDLEFDVILFQHRKNYEVDQHRILSEAQRRLPKIYLEHDPPQEHPTNTRHWVDDPSMLLVHVTDFNRLMWDNNRTPATVIDHGVIVPENVTYTGENPKGIVVVNNIRKRGRRLGLDVFEAIRGQIPLDLVGMGTSELGGLGEVSHDDLPAFEASYRFFFNPIRYTSLGLSVCEAMMTGLPIVGLATTEMATAVQNGKTGYVETSIDKLIERMRYLIDHPEHAKELGQNARDYANQRFHIKRFVNDWQRVVDRFVENAC
ncbi:Glycosyltransferase involved in cell wall bisynthesis [Nitrosospira sp. Nl5]|uniref:glycosyltransferase family 4 protein n=1 Tax=Nitrosospira sp. Nl5 TaxID=200120 RepID=UPI0008847215|nr:glycosyltransferase family 4 protein [Nitrosospira sp. Nl5]SCY30811.1 Glycosyltransferase involved in cell wall bisynthesis [Nitrosospira sp. Nl5]